MAFRVLVVCTANVCRSPLAEGLLRHRLPSSSFMVESAGLLVPDGARTDPHVVRLLTRRGVSLSSLSARRLTPEVLARADLILTATREHRGQVLEMLPEALLRSFTLVEFASLVPRVNEGEPAAVVRSVARLRSEGPHDVDLPDPIGQPDAVHEQVAEKIEEAVSIIAAHLARAAPAR